MVGFEKVLGAVKVIKDQIQYRSQSLLNLLQNPPDWGKSVESLLPSERNQYNWKTNSSMNMKVDDIIQYYAYKILDVLD